MSSNPQQASETEGASAAQVPQSSDTEVRPVAKQRRFTAEEQLRILTAYESASSPLERTAILRRERVYSSHISAWRRARDGGKIDGAKKVGRPRDPQAAELARLRCETAKLERELKKAKQVIDVQGKVSALLQMLVGESAEKKDA
jgi:transposase